MALPISIPVVESSQVSQARRVATTLARQLGFRENELGKVALVVTEAATNLVKHAREGELLLRPLERGGVLGLEILTLDKGDGMVDVGRCLVDGHSTAGSPGNGLGAISRIGDDFDIHSIRGMGTALVVRLWAAPVAANSASCLESGAICLPKPNEEVSGDAWAIVEGDGRGLVMVVDGLGHGPMAADASREAVRAFLATAEAGPIEALQSAHAALRSTRGAVMAVADLDLERNTVRYVGVGNIAASLQVPGESRSMVSLNGTVGHEVRKLQEFTYPWIPGSVLVMHSDGLATQWRMDQYPGLIMADPSLIAGTLYRDFKRGRDDVTVVAVREGSGGGGR